MLINLLPYNALRWTWSYVGVVAYSAYWLDVFPQINEKIYICYMGQGLAVPAQSVLHFQNQYVPRVYTSITHNKVPNKHASSFYVEIWEYSLARSYIVRIQLDQTGLCYGYYFVIIIVWLRLDRGSYILKELHPCGFFMLLCAATASVEMLRQV